MDAAWIGTVSALAGAGVGGLLAVWRDTRLAKQQSARDVEQREHERQEHRYVDRRQAFEQFLSTISGATDDMRELVGRTGVFPIDHGDGFRDKTLQNDILAKAIISIELNAPADVRAAASRCVNVFLEVGWGALGFEELDDAIEKFGEVARANL